MTLASNKENFPQERGRVNVLNATLTEKIHMLYKSGCDEVFFNKNYYTNLYTKRKASL